MIGEEYQNYQLIEQQQQYIRKQIEDESPLIGQRKILQILQVEYCQNEPFIIKIKEMSKKYSYYRKARRDGCCFYRAFIFRVFEVIVIKNNLKLKDQLLKKLRGAKQFLKKALFEGFIFEDIQDMFIEKINQLRPDTNIQQLVNMFCNQEISNYLVLMLRFLTSAELKNNCEFYETFIDNNLPIEFFCQTEVQPIDKEADQIQIMALLKYLQITIKIVYLDSNLKVLEPSVITFPQETKEKVDIILLYRPGHYDILYE